MQCRVCGKNPLDFKVEYVDRQTQEVVGVECETCAFEARVIDFTHTGRVTSYLWLKASMESVRTQRTGRVLRSEFVSIIQVMGTIEGLAKEFEDTVWLDGLRDLVQKSGFSSFSARGPSGSIMLLMSAGRVLITLSGIDDESVTLILAETAFHVPSIGIQGIDATADQAKDLIAKAMLSWRSGSLLFRPDANVGFA